MIKLRRDGWISYYRYSYINKPKSYFQIDLEPEEFIIVHNDRLDAEVILNTEAIILLSKIKSIEIIFNDSLADTPITDIMPISYGVTSIDIAIEAYMSYLIMSSINLLPYSDSAIDALPIIDGVIINGEESNLLNQITESICSNIQDIKLLTISKDNAYRFIYDDIPIFAAKLDNKSKNMRFMYIRVHNQLPIFKPVDIYGIRTLDTVYYTEIEYRWYKKNQGDLIEPNIVDYIYSVPDSQSILLLGILEYTIRALYSKAHIHLFDEHILVILYKVYENKKCQSNEKPINASTIIAYHDSFEHSVRNYQMDFAGTFFEFSIGRLCYRDK